MFRLPSEHQKPGGHGRSPVRVESLYPPVDSLPGCTVTGRLPPPGQNVDGAPHSSGAVNPR